MSQAVEWNTIHELSEVVRRGYQVLRLISGQRKFALGGATLLMTATSAGNTAVRQDSILDYSYLTHRLVDIIRKQTGN